MLQVLIIVILTCFYPTNNVLAQELPTTPHYTQHYRSEQSCYLLKEIIRINNETTPRTITNSLYDTTKKEFTITLHSTYINISEQSIPSVTMLKLCHEEVKQLTVKDVECGLTCTTEIDRFITNSILISCAGDFNDEFFNGNQTIIAFRPNRTLQSCHNLSMNLVLVDTDDVNECSDKETHNCSQNAQCFDKKCGYSCQCKSGYYSTEDNYTCLDIGIAFEMLEYTVSESTGKVEVIISTNLILNFAPVTVQVSSENGSAGGGMDFYPVMMNITFSPDNQSSLINIEVINDSEIETNETFTLLLTSFSSDVIIDTPSATVTIVDDDILHDDENATHICNTPGALEHSDCPLCDVEQCANFLINDGNLTNKERLTIVRDIIEELINVSKISLMPLSLQRIIRTLSAITETLDNINSPDMRIIEIFNNLLDPSQSDGWKSVLSNGHANASEILLHSAERYAMLLATTHSSSQVLSRSNIVVRSMQYSQPPSGSIQFPMKADLINITSARNLEASITIPQSLIQERMNHGKPLPAAFILFQNLPTTDFDETDLVSHVVSAQVGLAGRSFALLHDPVLLNFGIEAASARNGSSLACVYWNFSQPFGNGSWVDDSVSTKCISTSNNQTSVICASTHLTSFAVLVDVTGALGKISTDEQYALEVVSYVGCTISITCLIITVVFFLLQRKRLFDKVHYFVHLNLAFTLLLANLVFVSGIEMATVNEIACAFVAALLHYLFLSAFCWMLCEGIMLYLLLVVVFGSSSHKIWILMIIGYILPLPVVIITVSIRYQEYGVKTECDQLLYCWLSTKHGTIFGFVAPMLAIISVNVVFLLIVLRVLWRSKHQQLKRHKENTKTDIKTARAVMLASVVLLPLLGLTWAFGVLSVNENTTVFAWLFTIFNSLQGVFLFFFHVLRSEMWVFRTDDQLDHNRLELSWFGTKQISKNDSLIKSPIQSRISSKLQTLKGTLRSSYTSTTRWSNSTSRAGYNSTIHHRNGKQAVENASTCEINDNQEVPTDQDEEDSKVAPAVCNTDLANDETENAVTPTEPKSNGHDYEVKCATSRPVIERAMSDGSMVIEMQVDMTTQKLTVLKINQLLRRTRKLLTASQEIVEETMDTNMDSNGITLTQ